MQMNREKLSPVFFIPALLVAVLFGLLRSGEPARTEEKVAPRLEVFLETREVEVVSIEPGYERPGETGHGAPDERVAGYPVLGRVRISEPAELENVRGALRDLARAGSHWDGLAAGCYSPRHCLRISTAAGTQDLVICYECYEVQIFTGRKQTGGFFTHTEDDRMAATPKLLNALLKKHAVPLAEPPK